jgi:MFS family permease
MDAKRRQIAFINAAHFVDHYVLLIFPTVVIGLETDLRRSYAELIVLATACFVAFGLFSLPWGWLGDHWSRRKLMAIFFLGCAGSLATAAVAPNMIVLGVALFVLGIFAAIYHPVGITMLVANARDRGRDLAMNGVFGNLGVAFAPGVTAAIAYVAGWRMAFAVPAAICAVIGFSYTMMTEEGADKPAERARVAEMPLAFYAAIAIFGAFAVISLSGGLVFNIVTVAIPKVLDERWAEGIPLVMIGSVATAVLLFGGAAQLVMGRLVSKYPPYLLFAAIGLVQLAGVAAASVATGPLLLVALAVAIIGIYGQVTVGDVVLARYTADAWRGRIYSVRYFLAFISSGIAISLIAWLHGMGGFVIVLAVTALFAVLFAVAAFVVAYFASRVENRAAGAAAAPAE